MIYSLENSEIKITTSTHGTEFHSITGKREGTEYLWNRGLEYRKYSAPHLFPIVGRVVNSKYRVDGKTYEIPVHGLARISDFDLMDKLMNQLLLD